MRSMGQCTVIIWMLHAVEQQSYMVTTTESSILSCVIGMGGETPHSFVNSLKIKLYMFHIGPEFFHASR